MSILFHLFLPVIASPMALPAPTCAEEVRASAVANRLADLPPEIVEQLRAFSRSEHRCAERQGKRVSHRQIP